MTCRDSIELQQMTSHDQSDGNTSHHIHIFQPLFNGIHYFA